MTESPYSDEPPADGPLPDDRPQGQSASDDAASAAESRVRVAIDALDAVRDASPEDQLGAFAAVHQTLQATLSDIDSD